VRIWKLGAVLAVGFGAAVAQAEEYTDAKRQFRVTIPDGWTRTSKPDDELSVSSPNMKTTFGFCFVHRKPLPGTEGMSQAELDRRLTGKFPASHWRKQFADFKAVEIVASGDEVQNGRNTYYAVVTYKTSTKSHKFKTVVHVIPGWHYHLTCNAYLESYPREEVAFETFFDSFVPIGLGLKVGLPNGP
jgi:hypothetical protein